MCSAQDLGGSSVEEKGAFLAQLPLSPPKARCPLSTEVMAETSLVPWGLPSSWQKYSFCPKTLFSLTGATHSILKQPSARRERSLAGARPDLENKTTPRSSISITYGYTHHRNCVNSGSSLECHILPLQQCLTFSGHSRKLTQTLTGKLENVSSLKLPSMCLPVRVLPYARSTLGHSWGYFKQVAPSRAMEGAHSNEFGV